MDEHLLQFIWRFQYFNKTALVTTEGQTIRIINQGEWNRDQGPDFSCASVLIGNTRWTGNIEVHVNASDWHRHKHQKDSRYTNIILHVVWEEDIIVTDPWGNRIPTLAIESYVPKILLDRYKRLIHGGDKIMCTPFLPGLTELAWGAWKERLVIERMDRKAHQILTTLAVVKGDWEEISWRRLSANFGIHVNERLFEQIAVSLPYKLMVKHRFMKLESESLLFGQANLLANNHHDEYPRMMYQTYRYLSRKYRLHPAKIYPAFLRMRPAGFPTLRLSQLASLIHKKEALMNCMLEISDIHEAISSFRVAASEYWQWHYQFDELADWHSAELGRQMAENIVINTVVPVLYTYGIYSKQAELQSKSIHWLYQLSSERNRITASFVKAGVCNRSALDSQALLELSSQYCFEKKCLQCSVGNKVVR